MTDVNQLALIYDFNEKYRMKFNPDFFVDIDVGIVEEVERIILSIQRDKFFTIKVLGFDVIEDYETIMQTLYDYEEKFGYKNKNKKKDNIYGYINLKDSAIRLLVVHYYIAIKEEAEKLDVLIALPRAVDKYYFRLSGNTYSALWQIVDASTYNSSTSNSKKYSVTLKTMFMPVRIYRYYTDHKTSPKDFYTGEQVRCTYYTSYIFRKSLPVMKYILGKFGFYKAAKFFYIQFINVYDTQPAFDQSLYTFNRFNMWITIPRYLFDKSTVVQSFVYVVYMAIQKTTTCNDFFTDTFWLLSLANEFNNQNIEKGISILDSLEFIYDLTTKLKIRLPDSVKDNIYTIIRWMIGEFNNLMIKDNLDVSIKRIRNPAEYIAALLAMKYSTSIYRVSDIGKKATLDSIKKAIVLNPMYLVNAVSSCRLVGYKNFVGDLDSIVALKFTYKGIAGIGENNNSMPNIYRSVNPSQVGIVDLNSSSSGDPGASGILNPYRTIDPETGMFSSTYMEPNYWEDEFRSTLANYKSMVGKREVFVAANELMEIPITKDKNTIDKEIEEVEKLIKPIIKDHSEEEILNGVPLEESGLICYETLEDIPEE